MKVYGVSGLGADERVFERVNAYLEEPITYVPWIRPEANETLAHYAQRLSETIDTSEPFALVGISFGGMLSTEMNKHIKPERTILVSSCACREELPSYFRGVGRLNLVPYIPEQLMQVPGPLLEVILDLKEKESKKLMRDIIGSTDRSFIKWAVQAILTWDNTEIPSNIKRIHGKADRVVSIESSLF